MRQARELLVCPKGGTPLCGPGVIGGLFRGQKLCRFAVNKGRFGLLGMRARRASKGLKDCLNFRTSD